MVAGQRRRSLLSPPPRSPRTAGPPSGSTHPGEAQRPRHHLSGAAPAGPGAGGATARPRLPTARRTELTTRRDKAPVEWCPHPSRVVPKPKSSGARPQVEWCLDGEWHHSTGTKAPLDGNGRTTRRARRHHSTWVSAMWTLRVTIATVPRLPVEGDLLRGSSLSPLRHLRAAETHSGPGAPGPASGFPWPEAGPRDARATHPTRPAGPLQSHSCRPAASHEQAGAIGPCRCTGPPSGRRPSGIRAEGVGAL